ncbi:TPA: beta-1,6-N-acetylglucosaminyltransferase, partial [Morganella morganii]
METAVLIQTHNNAKYISTLAKRNPSVRFYVHVDNKTPLTYKEIEKNNISNLYLIKNRVDVYWGGSSQLIATLRLMMEAIKDSNNKYF